MLYISQKCMLTTYTSGEVSCIHIRASKDEATSSAFSAAPLAYDCVYPYKTMANKLPARASSFERVKGGGDGSETDRSPLLVLKTVVAAVDCSETGRGSWWSLYKRKMMVELC
jgi:hypothetical protein